MGLPFAEHDGLLDYRRFFEPLLGFAAFFDAFFRAVVGLARFLLNAASQPSEYFSVEPTRTIVIS